MLILLYPSPACNAVEESRKGQTWQRNICETAEIIWVLVRVEMRGLRCDLYLAVLALTVEAEDNVAKDLGNVYGDVQGLYDA